MHGFSETCKVVKIMMLTQGCVLRRSLCVCPWVKLGIAIIHADARRHSPPRHAMCLEAIPYGARYVPPGTRSYGYIHNSIIL